jgi:hypothetical protein
LALALPFACGDDEEALNNTTAGPSGSGGAGAAGSGTGGATSSGGGMTSSGSGSCTSSCPILCTTDPTTPSQGSCVSLGGVVQCNPISNQGCNDAIGEACDFGASGLQCYPPPNDVAVCDACGASGQGCKAGSTCAPEGYCAKFCCDDGDCGNAGDCSPIAGFNLGYCVKGAGQGGGGASASSSSGQSSGQGGSGGAGAAAGGAGGSAGAGGAGGN